MFRLEKVRLVNDDQRMPSGIAQVRQPLFESPQHNIRPQRLRRAHFRTKPGCQIAQHFSWRQLRKHQPDNRADSRPQVRCEHMRQVGLSQAVSARQKPHALTVLHQVLQLQQRRMVRPAGVEIASVDRTLKCGPLQLPITFVHHRPFLTTGRPPRSTKESQYCR